MSAAPVIVAPDVEAWVWANVRELGGVTSFAYTALQPWPGWITAAFIQVDARSRRRTAARETAERVLELTRPWRDCTGVVFDRRRENQVMLESMTSDDPIRTAYYARNREFLGLAIPLESCLTEDPLQVMLSGDVARMREAEAALRGAAFARDFALAATVYKTRNFSMIDVLNPVCSKGAALAEWAALRGVAREEVLAIGDNHNDLEMLAYAGIPVVMGNGVAELKGFGWHETASNDENGVAAAIEQFALREAAPCA